MERYRSRMLAVLVALALGVVLAACAGRGAAVDGPETGAVPPDVESEPVHAEVTPSREATESETITTIVTSEPLEEIDPALAGTHWSLTSMNGEPILDYTRITLDFRGEEEFDEQFGGFAGCNGYGVTFGAADEGILLVSSYIITVMGCDGPEGIGEQEGRYVRTLQRAASYEVADDQLEIRDDSGETILVFTREEEYVPDPNAITRTAWQLTSSNGDVPISATLSFYDFFDEDIASGFTGCRHYFSTYETDEDAITFGPQTLVGEGSCPQSEGFDFTDSLNQATRYERNGERLEIFTSSGETLVFEQLVQTESPAWDETEWRAMALLEMKKDPETGERTPEFTGVLEGSEITATFDSGRASGSTGCNHYSSFSSFDPVPTLEPLENAERACGPEELEQEERYLSIALDLRTFMVSGYQLYATTHDGRGLIFVAQEYLP